LRFCTVNIAGIGQSNARGFAFVQLLTGVLIGGAAKNNLA
jgi:hypothetical protein